MLSKNKPTVFVVDDDQAMRDSLRWLIESVGIVVETYANAEEFLNSLDASKPGCLLTDVRMPGLSGLELQDVLAERKIKLPVIIITGHADVPMAIRAMKKGAIEFIEKPFNNEILLERIRQGIEKDSQIRRTTADREEIAARLALLSAREQAVMQKIIDGKPNKVVAEELGLSQKTIEVHRASVMKKMRADSVAELVRLALALHQDQGKP